ncbi:MAG: hypothetical protein ACPMAQ_10425 [Phycisphaerae bacterium]
MAASRSETPLLASRPASRPAATGRLFEIWREEASRAGVPEAYIRLYVSAVSKVFAEGRGLVFRREDEARYRDSVRDFLTEHLPYLGGPDDRSARGVVLWLAWCTLEACDRRYPSDVEFERWRIEYLRLFDEVLAEVRSHLLPGPFPALPPGATEAIEGALSREARVLESRMTKLQLDFLYPALKGPLKHADRQKVLDRYRQPSFYPSSNESGPPFKNPQETYVGVAIARIKNLDELVLFDLLVSAVEPQVLHPKWWRTQLPTLDGGALKRWPALVTLDIGTGRTTTREVPE